jgi:hypothetical protein
MLKALPKRGIFCLQHYDMRFAKPDSTRCCCTEVVGKFKHVINSGGRLHRRLDSASAVMAIMGLTKGTKAQFVRIGITRPYVEARTQAELYAENDTHPRRYCSLTPEEIAAQAERVSAIIRVTQPMDTPPSEPIATASTKAAYCPRFGLTHARA